ncbi:MAG: hypothetical protein R6V26_15130 [Roseovarius sp.]
MGCRRIRYGNTYELSVARKDEASRRSMFRPRNARKLVKHTSRFPLNPRRWQALWRSIYRDSLFPRTEYAEAWKVLQRDLPRRDACRRMVDLLFIAHDQACEAELAHLLAEDLDAGQVPDPKALASRLVPRRMALPKDVTVAHTALGSFDALLEGRT